MEKIFKLLSNLITFVCGVPLILLVFLISILMPIMTIADGFKIINSGYTVTGDYISIMIVILVMLYLSLRFRILRKIYSVLPFSFETIKYLTIANLFISIGTEVLNWSYITLNEGRHKFGIFVFILSLILWRIFVSIYYAKKPIVNFIPKAEEKMQNYSGNV
ncbi:hypothetical protein NNC19_10265 [Clostridium sp. SHJSY1]|uniref:hypothetical protein n=1 Tax=Clostridium sp. SHJSY1 TaxID=2942483 RepID=UPI00287571EF|nr:hypothetical protein [Clostridium sp. SHJSY1]MDS0526064.1 hypothetical protein [Clostridium sp. SHJSY1]